MTKKVKIVLLIVLIFLIGLAVPSYSWTRKNIDQIAKFYNARMSPIIMIQVVLLRRTALTAWSKSSIKDVAA